MNNFISIVVPLYNERENVPILVKEIGTVLDEEERPFELVLVDDGSSDGTFEAVREAARHDDRVRGVRLSRNHGQTTAIKAGIEHASGRICITMDGDLQHDPAHIPALLRGIDDGYDLVCSYRYKRDDAFLRRFPSRVANGIARWFSRVPVRDFGSTFRACRTDIMRDIPIYGEMHRFIPVFAGMLTDRITEIPITLRKRQHGRSKYGLGRTFRVFSDLIAILFFARFFTRPIHIFGYISLLLGLPGLVILGWLSGAKILGLIEIKDYGPLFILGVLLMLVSGQVLTMGIVCEYLTRIYYGNEKHRSYVVAERTHDKER
ncbi:MAG: glycosyltransferase family 2 protein [Deltaproteobacteria bacterium]|nr:glycosyltransferase family 2 protein [Deltaproteobacteria bacterium]